MPNWPHLLETVEEEEKRLLESCWLTGRHLFKGERNDEYKKHLLKNNY